MKWALPWSSRLRTALLLLVVAGLVAGLVAWRLWPRQWLRRGEEALAAREYDQARDHLARYLGRRPNDPRGLLLAARAARRLREYYEALEYLRRCREVGGDVEAIEMETLLTGVQRGEAPSSRMRERAQKGDELALAILEVTIQYDIDHYRLRQALHGLNQYLDGRPDDLQALLARAHVWERFLYFADALNDYRRAFAAHPENERVRLKLGDTLLIAGTPKEALGHFEWLARRRPDQPEVLLGLARSQRRLGELAEARKHLDALLSRAPTHPEALWERGQVELDTGRAAAAEPFLRQAVAARPHDRRMAYSLSQCLMRRGQKVEAEKLRARVAAIDADLRKIDQLSHEVMARPDDAALRYEGGMLFLRNGEREEGLRWLRLAVRLDPSHQQARDALARAEQHPQ